MGRSAIQAVTIATLIPDFASLQPGCVVGCAATKARSVAPAICLRRFGFSPYYPGVSKTKHSRN
jgi:hypothetical protein